jgi:hypothetical protein
VGEEFWADGVGKSVTALEVEIGILADPEKSRRVWFYFREPPPYGDLPGSTQETTTATDHSAHRPERHTTQQAAQTVRTLASKHCRRVCLMGAV